MVKRLTSIMGNTQMLDGGAMFGNVPKSLWSQWTDVDEFNRIPLVCRALLVQENNRNILFETGIGAFFKEKLRERYGVMEAEHMLVKNLSLLGITHRDIDIVVLSHLHFDHAGGLLSAFDENQPLQLLFPNARFVISETAWQRANNPHPRDKASFIPELNELLSDSDRVHFEKSEHSELLGSDYRFIFSDGHTPGMMLSEISMPNGPVVFASDLIPGVPWIHVPITMGYDRAPECLINEKSVLLADLLERNGRLFFTHDPTLAMVSVAKNSQGRYVPEKCLSEVRAIEL